MGVGGLDEALDNLFRRVFASRMLPPTVAARMGVPHVKGVLMYGPPGTGKTLVARQIGRLMAGEDREPQVVNGPELLQRYVGQSEANIRALFEAAENEYKREGDNAGLHVIIFDEIDALCKARGRDPNGNGVMDSVVNQLLTKIDGVSSAPNVIVIGLTNRKDLLDPALLRPGRFEVMLEIGLPDADGRHEILKIHTQKMAENNMLGKSVDLRALAEVTRNFSGAELAGLVRSAASHAYHRLLNPPGHDRPEMHGKHGRGLGLGKVELIQEDFQKSLSEITPALGAGGGGQSGAKAFRRWMPHGILQLGGHFDSLSAACWGLVAQVKNGPRSSPMLTALLEGPPGTGKTALAATIASESEFPFARVVCAADDMVAMSNIERCLVLQKAFDDALASPLSCLVLDNLERILGFSRVGPVYSNEVLQTLLLLLRRPPPHGRRLLVIGTTSSIDVMQALEVASAFNVSLHVGPLCRREDKAVTLMEVAGLSEQEAMEAAALLPEEVPIKHLLTTLEMASAAERLSVLGSSNSAVAAAKDEEGEGEAAASMRVSVSGLKAYLRSLGALQQPVAPRAEGTGGMVASGGSSSTLGLAQSARG
mmetsp:Transcript_17117/g.47770  ORF Transcript_17117/g.47770 Transcript_17117/m.47770 type:complete len:595 (+) Transcript_17117:154-1938(+)